MAHKEQQEFCLDVKRRFPQFFIGQRVLDIGSLHINGNNRGLFTDSHYIGVDLGTGPNVDVVSKAHEYAGAAESFDVVLATEVFEHDRYYPKTLRAMTQFLRAGGLLFFTCATTARQEHGTRSFGPWDSPFTSRLPEWADYYKNLTEGDIRDVLNVDRVFDEYEFSVNDTHHDLRFWGIKGILASGNLDSAS